MDAILIALTALSLVGRGIPASTLPRQIVEIVGGDYAFLVPDGIHAGPATFRFVNRGKVRHELSIALLRPGVTVQQLMAARQAKARAGQLIEASVGVLVADGGTRDAAELSTTLLAGRDYVLICERKDSVGAAEHSALGMYNAIHLPSDADAPTASLPADTIVATDYAFQLPASLPPGHHAFAFANRGTKRHELKLFLLPRGQTLETFMQEHAAWRATRALGGATSSSALAVLVGGAGVTPRGIIELELEPGREYAFTCDFADSVDAPPHTALGMFGSIRVQTDSSG